MYYQPDDYYTNPNVDLNIYPQTTYYPYPVYPYPRRPYYYRPYHRPYYRPYYHPYYHHHYHHHPYGPYKANRSCPSGQCNLNSYPMF